jgi:hypothetical protein
LQEQPQQQVATADAPVTALCHAHVPATNSSMHAATAAANGRVSAAVAADTLHTSIIQLLKLKTQAHNDG